MTEPTKIYRPNSTASLHELLDGGLESDLGAKCVWRGQSDADWDLVSGLGRSVLLGERNPYLLRRAEDEALGRFRQLARPLLLMPPEEWDVLGWLAVMQHYGAPTRLLDWSRSPYVALYFATKEAGLLTACPCAVWAINWNALLEHHHIDDTLESLTRAPHSEKLQREECNRFCEWIAGSDDVPFPVAPRQPDQRMNAQQGVLTATDSAYASIRSLTYTGGHYLLAKIELTADLARDAQDRLGTMNITHDTLFPGLDGIGESVRLAVKRLASDDHARRSRR